jgi:hypothetical protein
MVPKLIGLVGRARVGKDTVANFFRTTHTLRRFAQPMKDAVKVLYGWSDLIIESNLKDEIDTKWGITPRTAMIHMAETTKQFIGPDFFIKRLFHDWKDEPIIISDVRFENEIREIHKRGGITIKISRSGIHKYDFEDHIDSLETTYEIGNDGSLDELVHEIEILKV